MDKERLLKQIEFIVEIDKVKQILRQNIITGAKRNENDAEHSWHMAVMAMVLSEYAAEEVDLLRVIKMVLIHDLVEIDAGDTFCYDEGAHVDKAEREERAAQRIFNLLPSDLSQEIWELWREFEDLSTPEARFAACLDRLQPLILNYHTGGHTWQKPGVNKEKVLQRNLVSKDNAPYLWEYINELIEESIELGFLKP